MALENVIDEIISQAEKQKREIIEQGKQEAWKILDEATKKAKERMVAADKETAKILEENRRMELSSTNIRMHKMYLEAKRSVLDELYSRTIERINNMDSAKRKELLHKLIEKAHKELDAKFIYCSSTDKEIISGTKGIHFKGAIDCLGGVIVENADGSVRINYTFDILLEQIKEAHLNEVAKKIF